MPKLQEVQSFCQSFLIRQAVPRQAKLCCNCHGACRQPAGLLGCDATMTMVPGPRWRHSYLMNWMSSEICQPSGVVHALSPRFGSYRSPNAVSQVRFAFADSGANCKSVHVHPEGKVCRYQHVTQVISLHLVYTQPAKKVPQHLPLHQVICRFEVHKAEI